MPLVLSGDGITSDNITSLAASKLTGSLLTSTLPSATIVQSVFATQGSQVELTSSGGQSALYGLPNQRLYGDLASVSITPKSASNNLIFMGHCGMTSASLGNSCGYGLTLVKNNTTGYDLGDYDWYSSGGFWASHFGGYPPNQHYQYIVNAGSTSSQTWYLKAWNYSEGNYQNCRFRNGTLIILEVIA